jgi:thiol:disulfide interchange protein
MLLSLVVLLSAPPQAPDPPGVKWVPYAEAVNSDKPKLVVVEGEDCFWCKKMDATTFQDAGVVAALADVSCTKVNADREPGRVLALFAGRELKTVPVMILYDRHRVPKWQSSGFQSADVLRTVLKPLTRGVR